MLRNGAGGGGEEGTWQDGQTVGEACQILGTEGTGGRETPLTETQKSKDPGGWTSHLERLQPPGINTERKIPETGRPRPRKGLRVLEAEEREQEKLRGAQWGDILLWNAEAGGSQVQGQPRQN
jgi:hypothetical protein